MMNETENHILMGETSRYLKNQWLREHGDTAKLFDNSRNGLDEWWMGCLAQKFEKGFYEFNANPYSGYALTALLTFHSFCHNPILKDKCSQVLDKLFINYAYGNMQQRSFPAFRRRLEREKIKAFKEDPASSIMKTLMQKESLFAGNGKIEDHLHHALLTHLSDYRLPGTALPLLKGEKESFFMKIGHQRNSSPEIYSGNSDYLLSAGGAQRGEVSQIVARPVALFLNDEAALLQDCFYLKGKGKMNQWNNTGVFKGFACASANVSITKQYSPLKELSGWQLVKPYSDTNFI